MPLSSSQNIWKKQPLGYQLDFQQATPTPAVLAAVEMASKLRLICFPNQGFNKCALFRGCPPAVLKTDSIVAEGDGYVVIWKHGQGGTVRISSVAWSDFWKEDFDTTQWNMVIYWDHRETSEEDIPTPPTSPPTDTDDPPPFDDPDRPMPPASPSIPEDSQPPDTPMPSTPEENQPVPRELTYPPPAPLTPEPDSADNIFAR